MARRRKPAAATGSRVLNLRSVGGACVVEVVETPGMVDGGTGALPGVHVCYAQHVHHVHIACDVCGACREEGGGWC